MISAKTLAERHEHAARTAFKATVESQIDAILEKNWFPGNTVTVVLDEVFPDADKRVRHFIVSVITATYGGDKADWIVSFENGVFLFMARTDQN